MKTSTTNRREMLEEIGTLRAAAGQPALTKAQIVGTPTHTVRSWLLMARQGIH